MPGQVLDLDAAVSRNHGGAAIVEHPVIRGRAGPLVGTEALHHTQLVERVEACLGATDGRERNVAHLQTGEDTMLGQEVNDPTITRSEMRRQT